jgi:hypothetical protein
VRIVTNYHRLARMVFTVPVRMGDQRGGPPGRSRRAVLGGLAGTAAGIALAGCWPKSNKPAAHPTPHPLTAAVAGTQVLVDRYQATIAGYPDLTDQLQPLLTDHRAHLDALRRAMGLPAASGSPTAAASAGASPSVAPDQDAALAALKEAEKAAQTEAVTACLAAAASYAPLLGSIAACRATHLEVLSS